MPLDTSAKNAIKKDLTQLLPLIKRVSQLIDEVENEWTDHFNENDPDDMYLRSMYYRIQEKLDDARRIAQHVTAEESAKGKLRKNSAGRYEITGSGVYFTSGSSIEFLLEDDGRIRWVNSRVEHNGKDYYIVAAPDLRMAGVMARTKDLPAWY
ncbi:DUF5348 domain-containing protein [Paenibacillus whitsoniae]|uniref:DUF5348 domain-containing protein n=1 Tax=Paenibacillus whitsoniae TaxID=2496558 RepID=A0A430J7N0_9BACL|nr:DUF5348 domain-containing protein [Paenibacillus whitsoniae]RTE05511.1 hypothetical protein EJQ19_25155 [Paenibacillus whitsoniae]